MEIIKYNVNEAEISKMSDIYMSLTIIDLDDQEGFEAVHTARMVLVKHRTAIDKLRKRSNEDAQKFIKNNNTNAKKLLGLMEPIETHLKTEENKVTKEKERIKAEADQKEQEEINKRIKALAGYGVLLPFMEVATLNDDEFDRLLAGAIEKYEFEQKRIADEETARKAETERLRLVGIEQAKEAERLAEVEARQKKREEEIRLEQEKVAKVIADEKAALKAEAERLDRIKFEEKAKAEARVQAIADAEAKAKREVADARAKVIADALKEKERIDREAKEKIEKEKAEAEEKTRLLELAPDKDRLLMFANKIHDFTIGELNVKSQEARVIFGETIGAILAVEATLRIEIKEL